MDSREGLIEVLLKRKEEAIRTGELERR